MRKTSFILCCFIFCSITALFSEQTPRLVLYSYPRSGTNFLTYTINNIVFYQRGSRKFSTSNRVGSFKNYHGSTAYNVLLKTKKLDFDIDKKRDYLIVLVRNYREAMLRDFGLNVDRIIEHIKDDSSDCTSRRYFEILKDFNQWPKDRRLLIYYEDLMTDTPHELRKIAKFLNSSSLLLDRYIKNLNYHKEKMLVQYNLLHNKTDYSSTKTMGKDMNYYSRQISFEKIKLIDNAAKERAPFLFKKYLERYDSDSSEDLLK